MSNTYTYFTRSVMVEIDDMKNKAFILNQMIDNCYDGVCSCEPRTMMGRSWWKQRGYNSPCSCLKTKLQNELEKLNVEFNTWLNKNPEIKFSLLLSDNIPIPYRRDLKFIHNVITYWPFLSNYHANLGQYHGGAGMASPPLGQDEIDWILMLC